MASVRLVHFERKCTVDEDVVQAFHEFENQGLTWSGPFGLAAIKYEIYSPKLNRFAIEFAIKKNVILKDLAVRSRH
jgi:hypothetical protein